MTGLDLITASLRLIGVTASGETLAASESTDGLNSLNDLLDSWSTEELLIPDKVREVFPFVPSQQIYTIGPGGNFNTSRPMRIENALLQLTATSPVTELPIEIITKDQFAGILQKGTTSTLPVYMYEDDSYPMNSLNFWPVPIQANNVVLYSWKPLANISTLTTSISLPPGYQRALRYNLAIELAPEYGRAVPDVVMAIATESKANIKRMNFNPSYLRVDSALQNKGSGFNWMTGDPS